MTCEDEVKFHCSPGAVSYCCNIFDSKDMSGIRHGMDVMHPCNICTASAQDFRNIVQSLEHSEENQAL